MSNNLRIIKISDLPDSRSVESTYFFGYDSDPNKPLNEQSVKIPFSAVAKASNERRIGIVMETNEQVIPIGEKMKITEARGNNLGSLKIKANNSSTNWTSVPLNDNTINIDLSSYVDAKVDALIQIERTGTDNTATVYLFTKILE